MFRLRLANMSDKIDIKELMNLSISELQKEYLTDEQITASFSIMGIDTQLIRDKTYFCVKTEDTLVGCGGWSMRSTLYGGNHSKNRDKKLLDPKKDRGRIRAMYTHPEWIRKGVGSLVMNLGEEAAKNLGFKKCELMATQSGKLLYEAKGYKSIEDVLYKTKSGKTVPMIRMKKCF